MKFSNIDNEVTLPNGDSMKKSRVLFLLLILFPSLLIVTMTAAGQTPVNQETKLTPKTSFDAPALEIDFPSLHIGVAEYEEGPTGATVFYFPKKVMAVVDVRGGAPGTTYTDGLRLGYDSRWVDAISFAGGSAYGLEAASGVSAEIRAIRENAGEWGNIVIVPGAIIFDLGPRRFNTIYPDKELGRAALRAARPGRFPLGAYGAGRFATQGSYFGDFEFRQHSGQGGAFRQVGQTKIAVFTIVNSVGAVVDRGGNVVRCNNAANPNGCGSIADYLKRALDRKFATNVSSMPATPEEGGYTNNTTITLVVTNQKLDYWELQRLAVQVHTSMGRAIQPFHTQRDGDALFAVSTEEVENSNIAATELGVLASEVAWDAVLSSVPTLASSENKLAAVDPKFYDAYVGRYEFGRDSVLTVTRDGNRLLVEATGKTPIYSFQVNQKEEIFPASATEFFSKNRRGDRLRFVKDGSNNVTGLTLNPGRWALPARKMQ